MKKCSKCGSVVKEWDVVCPSCGATLMQLEQPKDSIKVKGEIAGFESSEDEDSQFDKRLVRAAIKSDYEKGLEASPKALKALGQVSFISPDSVPSAGTPNQQKDAGEIEEISAADIDEVDEESVEEIGVSDIEAEFTPHKPGQIVVEGKKKDYEKSALHGEDSSLPSFPPVTPRKLKASFPPPQMAPPPKSEISQSQPEVSSPTAAPSPSAPVNPPARPQMGVEAPSLMRSTAPDSRHRKTVPVSALKVEKSEETPVPVQKDGVRKRRITQPPQGQKYDPDTLKKILQQAQAVSGGRVFPGSSTQISIPLAVLLVVMGTLSIVGIILIFFLLLKM